MNASQNKGWNKGARIGARAIGTGVGAILGGPSGAAKGNAIGASLDPLMNTLFPVFDDNYLVKHNISTGTMSDNYQYGKTEDAYSLVNEQTDKMGNFNKSLGYWDMGMQGVGFAGGVSKKIFEKGTEIAGKAILTGGMGGGAAASSTSGGIVGSDGMALTNSSTASLLGNVNTSSVPMDIKPKAQDGLNLLTYTKERKDYVDANKTDYTTPTFFDKIGDNIYNINKKMKQRENDAFDNMVDKDLEEEFLWNDNFTTPYQPMSGYDKKKRFSFFNRRKNNVPSY